jgi:hypothetical protein
VKGAVVLRHRELDPGLGETGKGLLDVGPGIDMTRDRNVDWLLGEGRGEQNRGDELELTSPGSLQAPPLRPRPQLMIGA